MAVSNEMMLFANNFAYLTSCGFRTDLRFSCSEDGKIIADIHLDLGHFASLFPPPPIITPEPIKPSQLRRRRRREHARNYKLNSSKSNLNFPKNDNVSSAHTMPTTNVNEEAAEGLDVGTVDVRCEPECNKKNDKPDLTHYQTPINCIRQEDGCELLFFRITISIQQFMIAAQNSFQRNFSPLRFHIVCALCRNHPGIAWMGRKNSRMRSRRLSYYNERIKNKFDRIDKMFSCTLYMTN